MEGRETENVKDVRGEEKEEIAELSQSLETG